MRCKLVYNLLILSIISTIAAQSDNKRKIQNSGHGALRKIVDDKYGDAERPSRAAGVRLDSATPPQAVDSSMDRNMLVRSFLGDGEIDGNLYQASSVAVNDDGTIIAIGLFRPGSGSLKGGQVNVYAIVGFTWELMGNVLHGEAHMDEFGTSVSLSSDGFRLAVGAYLNDGNGINSGHVRVFEFQETRRGWRQLGADIDGEGRFDFSGSSVALAGDGYVLAVGAYGNDGNLGIGYNIGHVIVYAFYEERWVPIGADIDGENKEGFFGRSVATSFDGKRLAVGSTFHESNGSASGAAFVYEFKDRWLKVGAFYGVEDAGIFGSVVSMSSDGSRVVVGSFHCNELEETCAQAQVYDDSEATGVWRQVGQDITEQLEGDLSLTSIAMSGDGNTIALGSHNVDSSGRNTDFVRVYSYFKHFGWRQVGDQIYSEAEGYHSGVSVALTYDGDILVLGSHSEETIAGHIHLLPVTKGLDALPSPPKKKTPVPTDPPTRTLHTPTPTYYPTASPRAHLAPPTYPPTAADITAECLDDPHYRDPAGLRCVEHVRHVCHSLHAGMSQAAVLEIMVKCPRSCGYCNGYTLPEHRPTATPTHSPTACVDDRTYRYIFGGLTCANFGVFPDCALLAGMGFSKMDISEIVTHCPKACKKC